VLYLFGIILFESIYLGATQFYFASNALSEIITKGTMIIIAFFAMAIIRFTQVFLETIQFPKLHTFFNIHLWIIPFIGLSTYNSILLPQSVVAIYLPVGIALLFTAYYALFKGVKQARYYVIGWSIVIVALLLTILKSFGITDVSQHFRYINETAFTLEALLFSIALAHRIKILSDEKQKADRQLILHQQNEQKKLEILVTKKTKDLSDSLVEKELLYQELNHRVKNNLHMIRSLVRLQNNQTTHKESKMILTDTENRINSIALLYEKLNLSKAAEELNTLHYFEEIIQQLKNVNSKHIEVTLDINHNLNPDTLLYIGIILNELLTNAFKYAFKQQSGEVSILLDKSGDMVTFSIHDNGEYFENKSNNSLGLRIVENLVSKQLKGEFRFFEENGTKVMIMWVEKD
jgi:two-component sensor histidine kinase